MRGGGGGGGGAFVFLLPNDGGQRSKFCERAVDIQDCASVNTFDDWSLDFEYGWSEHHHLPRRMVE